MTTIEADTKALLAAIELRLSDISTRQHALAVEKTRLLEQLTPLRLGVVAPDMAMVQLKAQGITLRGLTPLRATAGRPRRVILKAVAPLRPVVPLAR